MMGPSTKGQVTETEARAGRQSAGGVACLLAQEHEGRWEGDGELIVMAVT